MTETENKNKEKSLASGINLKKEKQGITQPDFADMRRGRVRCRGRRCSCN